MTEIVDSLRQDGSRIVRLRSEHLEVDVAPEVGGRIVGIRHLGSGHEFLWRNSRLRLEPQPPGSEYDPNFYGGIDELLPNDIPETIDGVACPDHGELWTRSLDWRIDGQRWSWKAELPRCGLTYQRRMRLRADSPHVDFHYRLTNPTGAERHFLWKLHAALAVEAGDVIDCPARHGPGRGSGLLAVWHLEPVCVAAHRGSAGGPRPAAERHGGFLLPVRSSGRPDCLETRECPAGPPAGRPPRGH